MGCQLIVKQSYKHKHVRQGCTFIFIARLKTQIDIMESWGCTVCKLFVVFFIAVFVVVVFVVLVFIVVVFVKAQIGIMESWGVHSM